MKLRLAVLIATLLLGAPLASCADTQKKAPAVPPQVSVDQPTQTVVLPLDSRRFQEFWKDN